MTEKEILLKKYETYLIRNEMADNTIKSYMWVASYFMEHYGSLTKKNVMNYKKYLMDNYKPSTVNCRIQAINRFLEYNHKKNLTLKTIRIQSKPYVDNVISNAEYKRFLYNLKKDNRMKYYMIVRTLICTGARVSELVQFQIEDVYEGFKDIYGKGGKLRRIYFTNTLRSELKVWLADEGRLSGPLFLNKNGITISIRGIETMLKKYATEYHIDPKVVHPHAFRHRYALNFLKKRPKAISELADILGHSSLNTTMIYARRTAQEQFWLINSTVDW